MRKCLYLFILLVLFISVSCSRENKLKQNKSAISTPLQMDDGWQCAKLSNAGVDSQKLQTMIDRIYDRTYQNVHSVLLIKDGKLVFEQYFPGYAFKYEAKNFTGTFTNFDANTTHNLASVTKSITSILFGIAMERGLVKNVDEKLFKFFPQYVALNDSLKDQIKLLYVLTMTSGLQWNEQDVFYSETKNDIIQLFLVPDPVKYILLKPVIHRPGTNYYYNGGGTNLLGEIIHRTSGLKLDAFAKKYLFAPLRIEQYKWLRITPDVVYASGDLKLRPRDMAKIGLLMLNDGSWKSKKIVSSKWVRKSTEPYVHFNAKNGYAYQWWIKDYELGNVTFHSFAAEGWGGQEIIILRDLNAVVVLTAGNYTTHGPNNELLYRYILPAFDKDFRYDFEKIKNEAPIADSFKVIKPSGNLNGTLARLSGHWYGRGDYSIADQFVVEKIDSTQATVLYSWGDHPAGLFKRGWRRTIAQVDSAGKITLLLGTATLTFEMEKNEDVLIGYYRKGDASSKLIMDRL